MIRIITYISVFLLLCTMPTFAADYYVRTDGHDSNCNGTVDVADGGAAPNCAWLTVAHAADTVAAATHTINVDDGTYSETQIVLKEGVSLTSTNSDNTLVKIQPSADMAVDSPLILLSSTTGGDGSQTISHLEIDGINGANVARLGISIRSRDNVQITQNNIHSFYGVNNAAAITVVSVDVSPTSQWWNFWVVDPQEPGTDTNINTKWSDAGLVNPVEGLEIDNNTIDDCGYAEGASGLATMTKGSITLWHIKDSSIHDNTGDNTNSEGQFLTGRGGKTAILDNVDIYNNTFVMGPQSTQKTNFMIEFWISINCEIYDNTIQGYASITVTKNTKIYSNSFIIPTPESNRGIGIEFTTAHYGELYNNFISGANGAIYVGINENSGSGNWTMTNTSVHNNIAHNYNLSGITINCRGNVAQSRTQSVTGIHVFNNIFDGNDGRGNRGIYVIQENQVGTCALSDVVILNNVTIDNSSDPGLKVGTVTSITADTELFHGNSSSQWSGLTATNINTNDPSFEDEGANFNGYTPSTGSAVIDAGRHLTRVNDGNDCTGVSCTEMIVDTNGAGFFRIGDYVFVDAATDFIELVTGINYSTHTLTLNAAHDHEDDNEIYLAYSTTIGIMGAEVDLGAIEYDLIVSNFIPADDTYDISIDVVPSWTNPTATVTVDVYFDTGACGAVCGDTQEVTNGANTTESYDPGTLTINTDYCIRVDIDHAGGTETGNCYGFTTTGGPPPSSFNKVSGVYDDQGVEGTYDDRGLIVVP